MKEKIHNKQIILAFIGKAKDFKPENFLVKLNKREGK